MKDLLSSSVLGWLAQCRTVQSDMTALLKLQTIISLRRVSLKSASLCEYCCAFSLLLARDISTVHNPNMTYPLATLSINVRPSSAP
jgi:hypothetical protein